MRIGFSLIILKVAPEAGFEPTTCELTARCSTVELFGINVCILFYKLVLGVGIEPTLVANLANTVYKAVGASNYTNLVY